MKIGIMGGTFNPIHHGHLINAQFVREEFGLEKIIFIPSKKPVHKNRNDDAPADDRCRMVEIAIAGNSAMELSRAEVDRESPSYTITTVDLLLESNPGWDMRLIIGYDSYRELDTWKDHERLLDLVSVIVMNRPVEERQESPAAVNHSNCVFAHNPMIEISSTVIRDRIRQGMPVNYLLPPGVIDYIEERGLYKS